MSISTTPFFLPEEELVAKDHLLVALGDRINPVVTEWGAIESKLTEIVTEHLLANRTSTAPRFDTAKISGAWEGLSLKLIPAQEILVRPCARIRLSKMLTDANKMLECLMLQNPNIYLDDWSPSPNLG
ncbi:uncharacterized protein LOC135949956 [Calliphora vicina]|uniref:uncharacterized protein LOC135949956 n=1 Tax=Calliphora vicina TaxID=7373 RepID=UPI00325B26E2